MQTLMILPIHVVELILHTMMDLHGSNSMQLQIGRGSTAKKKENVSQAISGKGAVNNYVDRIFKLFDSHPYYARKSKKE